MQPDSLAQRYSSKTDDELLTLAADQGSLTPEARALLATELDHRKLIKRNSISEIAGSSSRKHPPSPIHSDEINLDENPTFNVPAKVAHILFFVCLLGAAVGVVFTIIRYDTRWKEEIASIVIGMLLIFGPIFVGIIWVTRRYFRNKPIGRLSKL